MNKQKETWRERFGFVFACVGAVLLRVGSVFKPLESWLQKTKWHNLPLDMVLRLVLVVLMLSLLVLAMGYHWTGKDAHEVIASFLLVLVFAHLLLNWRWYVWLFEKGFSSPLRQITVINLLLSAIFLLLLLSLSFVSKNEASFGFMFHNFCAHLLMAVMAIHLGLNWNIVLAAGHKAVASAILDKAILWRAIIFVMSVYAVLFSFKKSLGSSFGLEGWQVFNSSALGISLGYTTLIGFYAAAAYYASKYAKYAKSKQHSNSGA